MGAGRRNEEESNINSASAATQSAYQNFMGLNQGLADTEKKQSQGDLAGARSGYKGYSDTGASDQASADRMKAIFGGGPESASSFSGYQDLAKTGGVSADQLSSIMRPSLTNTEQYGATSQEGANNLMRRGASAGSSIFGAAGAQAARQRAITGMNVGGGSLNANLARGSAQAANAANLQTANSLEQNKMQAGNQLAGLGLSTTGMIQSGKEAGLSGLTGLDQFYKSGQMGTEQALQAGHQFGTSGLAGLGTDAASRAMGYQSNVGNALTSQQGAAQNYMGQRLQNDQINKPAWQSIMGSLAGGLGSLAGGFAGGGLANGAPGIVPGMAQGSTGPGYNQQAWM